MNFVLDCVSRMPATTPRLAVTIGGKVHFVREVENMKRIRRDWPKIDRIACSWPIKKLLEPAAEFLYVPSTDVLQVAKKIGAIPYDVASVELTREGPLCSLDAFLKKLKLNGPALDYLAVFVRAADTNTLEESARAPGLIAITLGLSKNISDDEIIKVGMLIYEVLCSLSQCLKSEEHGWNTSHVNHIKM